MDKFDANNMTVEFYKHTNEVKHIVPINEVPLKDQYATTYAHIVSYDENLLLKQDAINLADILETVGYRTFIRRTNDCTCYYTVDIYDDNASKVITTKAFGDEVFKSASDVYTESIKTKLVNELPLFDVDFFDTIDLYIDDNDEEYIKTIVDVTVDCEVFSDRFNYKRKKMIKYCKLLGYDTYIDNYFEEYERYDRDGPTVNQFVIEGSITLTEIINKAYTIKRDCEDHPVFTKTNTV